MDNEIVDAAVKDLLDKPFIRGFRAGAIVERTGLNEAVIVKCLDELACDGHLVVAWELVCNNCSSLISRYVDRPTKIEAMRCQRCEIEPFLSEADLHKSYFHPGRQP